MTIVGMIVSYNLSMRICHFFAGSTTLTKRDITHKVKCIKCDQISYKGVREKYRLSERNRAQQFLDACRFRQDHINLKLAAIETVESLIAADIYAHDICIKTYLQEYELELSRCAVCKSKCGSGGNTNTLLGTEEVFDLIEKAREMGDDEILSALKESVDESN